MDFEPQRLFRGPHLQTVLSEIVPRRPLPTWKPWAGVRRRELFEMPDGDRLAAFVHLQPSDPRRRRPVVLHLHGLEGHADTEAQRALSAKAFAAGFHSVRLSFRNCGDTESLARDLYYGSRPGDLDTVVRALHEAWGFETVHVTGISLGANLLLRHLADRPADSGIARAAAISAPIEMGQALEALSRGANRIYDRYFLAALKRKLRRKLHLSPDGDRLRPYIERMAQIRSLAEWDEHITAPLGGFASAEAYYQAGSSGPDLDKVRVPTLLIHAKDDPFIPFAMYEQHGERIRANAALCPRFPEHGGHAGFWARARGPEPWMDTHWAENRAIAFLADGLVAEREGPGDIPGP